MANPDELAAMAEGERCEDCYGSGALMCGHGVGAYTAPCPTCNGKGRIPVTHTMTVEMEQPPEGYNYLDVSEVEAHFQREGALLFEPKWMTPLPYHVGQREVLAEECRTCHGDAGWWRLVKYDDTSPAWQDCYLCAGTGTHDSRYERAITSVLPVKGDNGVWRCRVGYVVTPQAPEPRPSPDDQAPPE